MSKRKLTTADMLISQFLGDDFYSPEEREQIKSAKEFTGISVIKRNILVATNLNVLQANALELQDKEVRSIRTSESFSCYSCGRTFEKRELTSYWDDVKLAEKVCPCCGESKGITSVKFLHELAEFNKKDLMEGSTMRIDFPKLFQ